MEVLEKIKINSCFIAKYVHERILWNEFSDIPRIEFFKSSDLDVKMYPQNFDKVFVSEIDLTQNETNLSESELAKNGIILVKRYKLSDNSNGYHPFYPQRRSSMEGKPENYAWIRIKRI